MSVIYKGLELELRKLIFTICNVMLCLLYFKNMSSNFPLLLLCGFRMYVCILGGEERNVL